MSLLLFHIGTLQEGARAAHIKESDFPADAPTVPNENTGLIMMLCFVIGSLFMVSLILVVLIIKKIMQNRYPLQLSHNTPGQFADEQDEMENILTLSPEEQIFYKQAKFFLKYNPPDLATDLTVQQYLDIEEKGLSAWDLIPNPSTPKGCVMVDNKLEIRFTNNMTKLPHPVSLQTNLPIPKTNDVYYFETKIFQLADPENTMFSIGLSTRPYPFFRLPGRHHFSVAYDSDGTRRLNNSFDLEKDMSIFPKLEKGDVVGIGYRTRSGKIFFTRNGKKLNERKLGGHIKNVTCLLYPTIGSTNSSEFHLNIGQMGYVFIEANVKKWGFANLEGTLPPPPPYNQVNDDMLIESGSEYDESELMLSSNEDDIPHFPPPFWASNVDIVDTITLKTLDSCLPPLYSSGPSDSIQGTSDSARQNGDAVNESDHDGETNLATRLPMDEEQLIENTQIVHAPITENAEEELEESDGNEADDEN